MRSDLGSLTGLTSTIMLVGILTMLSNKAGFENWELSGAVYLIAAIGYFYQAIHPAVEKGTQRVISFLLAIGLGLVAFLVFYK